MEAVSWLVAYPGSSQLGATEYDQNVEKSFAATTGGKLVIDADRGPLKSPRWGRQSSGARVSQVKWRDQSRRGYPVRQSRSDLRSAGNTIRSSQGTRSNRFGRLASDAIGSAYEVSLPKKFDVELKTSGGNIQTGDLEGMHRAQRRRTVDQAGRIRSD